MPKKLFIAVMIMLCTSMLSRSALSASNPSGSNGGAIPLYPGMQSKGDATTQDGIAGVRYCSNASTTSIRQFYKKLYVNAFEIEKGTASGVTSISFLLDVMSPAPDERDRWR